MNRRKFLGLTIGGVAVGAAGVPEFILANSQSTETQSPSSATGSIHISHREKAELRGPVRTCGEETVYPSGKSLTTTEYSLDGKLLTTRFVRSNGSELVKSQTYDADGRLVKTASGELGDPATESLYAYDDAGRLRSITNSPEKGKRTDFSYDEQGGRKTTTQGFQRTQDTDAGESQTSHRSNEVSFFTGSPWDAAESGFGVPAGGSVTTIYGENDQPTEAQVRDAEGRLASRVIRTYDANGRIIEENRILENPALLELSAGLNDKQLETWKSIMSGKNGTGTSYTYDAQGRVTEVRERNWEGDRVTTSSFNEHGDKSEDRMTVTTDNRAFPGHSFSMDENGTIIPDEVSNAPSVPEPPRLLVTEYRYEYDRYGNWTEQTVVHRSESNEFSNVRNRKLTYY